MNLCNVKKVAYLYFYIKIPKVIMKAIRKKIICVNVGSKG